MIGHATPTKREPMQGSAVFSDDQVYRYELTRTWGDPKHFAVFIMLNPSTADASLDDPTIRRCIRFAQSWGFGALRVLNIFALRSTDPAMLYEHRDPIGERNDAHIRAACRGSGVIIAAWGAHGALKGRGTHVRTMLAEMGYFLKCLGTTKGGHPRHPLYVPGNRAPTVYPERPI